ncbi:MAG: DUF1549 domain-containing protein, partial [Planctomycetales bacterium]|nr:DUF1549 domain-containing protein [Planctomycetales bacterium]
LSEHCFACHGPDTSARESGLRLDTFRGATARAYSGRRAIVPGDAAASELIARVSQHSGEQIMPPDGHNPLSVAQVQLLRAWIDDGAEYTSHWAFLPVRKVTPPTQPFFSSRNIIDLFVAQQLESRGLTANPPADARTLIRRVTLDLTGLPPSASELQALCDNWSEESYLDYVDRLLASPRYGEHMATSWLDAARYADTNGYQHDNGRKMWAWRDWVVNAMNRNMPFDQFVVEQLAGDLLPEPTEEQVIATGFNRNHGLNFEGGSIAAESLTEYVVDRTNVFGTTFLGLTVGCSQCHDHKYDPLTQVDYYGLLAYFNNNDDEGFAGTEGNAKPTVDVQWPAHDQLIAQLEEQLKQLASQTSELVNSHRRELNAWENRVLAGDEPIEPPGDMLVYLPLDGTESSIVSAGPEGIKVAAQNWRIDGSLTKCEGKVGSALHFDGSTLIDCGDIGQFDSEDAFSYGAWVYADGAQGTPILGRAKFHGYDLQFDNGHFLAEFVNRWDINAIFVRTEEQFAAEQWHHVVV